MVDQVYNLKLAGRLRQADPKFKARLRPKN